MSEWLLLPCGSGVGNGGEDGDLHSTMPGHNHLRDGTHADGISSEARQGTHLRGGFITRSRNCRVYPGAQRDFSGGSGSFQKFYEALAMSIGQINEAIGSERAADPRGGAHEIQVLGC